MCDTIDNELTAETVASLVELEREDHKGAILIVEGDTDSIFFKRFIDTAKCKVVVANGKENASGAITLLNKDRSEGILCILDADFHHLGVRPVAGIDNVVISDFHDIEILMIESPALEKLVDEFSQQPKLQASTRSQSVRDLLYIAAQQIGALRFWSVESATNLTFKRLKNTNYNFISLDNLSCDFDAVLRSVFAASSLPSVQHSHVLSCVDEVLSRHYDRRHLCNGHDICWILSRALRKLFGSEDSKSVCIKNIERILRIGYDLEYFSTTDLYKSIADWQNNQELSVFA